MARLFGTDGVRGVANRELSCELAFRLGQAGARVLAQEGRSPSILMARDTRASGDMLEAALTAGICSVGARALAAGVLPTAAVACLTQRYGADAGVMISASHNPVEYNGIKFFSGAGYKLSDALEDRIEAMLARGPAEALPTGGDVGRRVNLPDARRDYIDTLVDAADARLDGLRVVLDCANGAASCCAAEALERLGARAQACFCTPDGTDINRDCGSTHPEALRSLVLERGADAGLAFDGDADRLIAVDERGDILDGDRLLAIFALEMHRQGRLRGGTVVATVMSNMGLELALSAQGIACERTRVGDRYVLERMREGGFSLGGEQSGHIIFLDHATTGDGILSAIQLLCALARSGRPLSELGACMTPLPQSLVNVRVSEQGRRDFAADPAVAARIGELERGYAGRGRVLVRASGTEPLVRVMIEGSDRAAAERDARGLAELIRRRFAPEDA